MLIAVFATDPHAAPTIVEPDDVVDRHIADALPGLEVADLAEAEAVVDVGAGAGVPALVLAAARPDGTLFGDGQGISTTADGDVVTWHGSGIGKMTASGGTSFRGAIYYSTTSSKFAEANGLVGVFEFENDASGKTTGKTYAWT